MTLLDVCQTLNQHYYLHCFINSFVYTILCCITRNTIQQFGSILHRKCSISERISHNAFRNYLCSLAIILLKTCGATRNPEFPRTGPDRTETGPGSGNIFKNIFGSGRVGEYYFGSVRVGVFLTRVWDIFSRDFGDKLEFHSQTEEVEWLLSLISTFTVKTVFRD